VTGTGDGLVDAGAEEEAEGEGEGESESEGEGGELGEADGGGAEAPLTVECPVSVGAAELSPPLVEQPTRTSTPTAHTIAELRVSTTHSLSRRHLNNRHIRVPCREFSRLQAGLMPGPSVLARTLTSPCRLSVPAAGRCIQHHPRSTSWAH
jgi:hypothetical protein